MDIGISIVVTFVLVLVNGYFSMSEMALVNGQARLAAEGGRRGRRARRSGRSASPQDSGQFLATIQVAITLVGFFASAAVSHDEPVRPSGEVDAWVSASHWLSAGAPRLSPRCSSRSWSSYLSPSWWASWCPSASALADPETGEQDGGRPSARVPEDRLAARVPSRRPRPTVWPAYWASRTATRPPRRLGGGDQATWWPTTTSCWKTRSA